MLHCYIQVKLLQRWDVMKGKREMCFFFFFFSAAFTVIITAVIIWGGGWWSSRMYGRTDAAGETSSTRYEMWIKAKWISKLSVSFQWSTAEERTNASGINLLSDKNTAAVIQLRRFELELDLRETLHPHRGFNEGYNPLLDYFQTQTLTEHRNDSRSVSDKSDVKKCDFRFHILRHRIFDWSLKCSSTFSIWTLRRRNDVNLHNGLKYNQTKLWH